MHLHSAYNETYNRAERELDDLAESSDIRQPKLIVRFFHCGYSRQHGSEDKWLDMKITKVYLGHILNSADYSNRYSVYLVLAAHEIL